MSDTRLVIPKVYDAVSKKQKFAMFPILAENVYMDFDSEKKLSEVMETQLKGKINDAPANSQYYARKDNEWVDVTNILLPPRYGVRVADNESNPLMERLYDAVGMVANVGTSLTDSPRNDFDNVFPFNEFTEETINGRVMIRIPKFYVRREYYEEDSIWYREWAICRNKFDNSYVIHEMFLKGNVQYTGNNPESDYNDYVWVAKYETSNDNQSISGAAVQTSQARATMRNNARAIGDGWAVMDIATWMGLWTLFHIVFANRNSQDVMKGNHSGAVKTTGLTDGAVASCIQVDNSAMSFYGIENLYCNVYKWIDGINVNALQTYICTNINDFADDTDVNYRQVGYINGSNSGFITKLGYDVNNKFAEFPIATAGSSTTYYSDFYYGGTNWRVLFIGGDWNDNVNLGISFFNVSYTSPVAGGAAFGSRLTCRPF